MRVCALLLASFLLLVPQGYATQYDLCARGIGDTFTRTLRVELSVDGPELGNYADRVAAQLIEQLLWRDKATQIFVERYDDGRCRAALGERREIAISVTQADLDQLALELQRGSDQPSKTVDSLAKRAAVSESLASTDPSRTPFYTVRVYFATDRKEASADEPAERFGSDRAQHLSYGAVHVTIPKEHELGELETPSIIKLEFRADPAKHITVQSVESLTRDGWRRELRGRATALGKPGVLLFVHGYNVSFADAARRTGQLAYDLGFAGPTVFFSWPSRGSLAAYPADVQSADWATPDLKSVLADLAGLAPGAPVYIVAHSLGGRVMTSALQGLLAEDLAKRRAFKEIVLAAPDIDAGVFKRDIAPSILGVGPRFTLYASANDAALAAAKRVHGVPRLGNVGGQITVLPDLDTVDASSVKTDFVGHSYFADRGTVMSDLFYLIRKGLKPGERFSLEPAQVLAGMYWRFRK